MIVLHAIWTDAVLHLWGEGCPAERTEPGSNGVSTQGSGYGSDPSTAGAEGSRGAVEGPHGCNGGSGTSASGTRLTVESTVRPETPPTLALAVSREVLRSILGDVYDSLLVSGAAASELTLRLPHRNGRPIPSRSLLDPPAQRGTNVSSDPDVTRTDPGVGQEKSERVSLLPSRVPTLVFGAADAVDLLTASPVFTGDDVHAGASLRYWSRVAGLVLELLGKQRFVPAIHHAGGDRYRSFWRVVVDDEGTSERLGALISSMPPVCRSQAVEGEPIQASTLVERFLWTTVDALIRRCLEGDELAHAIPERVDDACSLQMRWLRSVVSVDANLSGTSEQRRSTYETVQGWLSKLEPPDRERTCRTCFHLHPPPVAPEASGGDAAQRWKLTLHVQATQNPELILDAARLWDEPGDDPLILQRPFDRAREQLCADVTEAARHFPPLTRCADSTGPVECHLTLEEAYSFLRDAAPILESEGFGVWIPKGWRDDRPRLRMWLEVSPLDEPAVDGGLKMGLDALVSYNWRVAVGDEELSLEEISQLAATKEPLVRLRGRWTEVQPSDVQAAVRFLEENRGGRITLFDALRQCYLGDDLGTGLPVAGLRAHGWIENFLDAGGNCERLEPLPPPAGFHGTLRPYQIRGMEWLMFLGRLGLGACLADDMGLGKTIQLIALWLTEREANGSPGPTLLVVPMSLVGNWQREIERFAPSLTVMVHHGLGRLTGREFVDEVAGHDIVISTYALIPRDLEHLAAVDWHRIALDEAQNIKNPAAKQAVAIRSLRSVHRVALTGTPVENRLSELWSIIDFLNAGYLGSATEFRRRFAVPIERYHDADRAQRLRHLIRPFVLRRLKSDPKIQVDLPEKMEMKVYCNLTREQAALYEALVGDMLGQIDGAAGIQRRGLILATLVKLKQVCNHPAHFLADASSLPHRSGKCDRLTEMLEEVLAEGDRAIIFTQFRKMGELLKKLLQESLDRKVLFLHGGTTRKNRDAMVDCFQDGDSDAPMLLLSLKAGGYGLNLTAASHVFHFDRWWNPAVEDQATDRAHRIGQDKRVQVHKFVCIGTLEERIDAMLEKKRHLADNILGRGEEWLTELSTDKLREMFALSRDAVAEE